MKLFEIRLYKVKILKNDEILYEGEAENMPETLKNEDSKEITLENGEAVIQL